MANNIFCAGCRHWLFASEGGGRGFYYCDWLDTDSLLARKTFCGGREKEPRTEKKSRKDEWRDWYRYKGGREKVRYSRKVTQVLKQIKKEKMRKAEIVELLKNNNNGE